MKRNVLMKQLNEAGAKITEGSKHTKVRLNNKRSVVPRHNEIQDQLAKEIKKQLGIL